MVGASCVGRDPTVLAVAQQLKGNWYDAVYDLENRPQIDREFLLSGELISDSSGLQALLSLDNVVIFKVEPIRVRHIISSHPTSPKL